MWWKSPPRGALNLAEATIVFSFNADTVANRSGLLTKDASGNGDHFAAYIQNGVLTVRSQTSDGEIYLTAPGIQAGVDYRFQAVFDGVTTSLYLDDQLVGSADFRGPG